jgi:phage/conjugal plasmid C-4 type zinc finger TraR family protein
MEGIFIMADFADRAAAAADEHLRASLARMGAPSPPANQVIDCVECGKKIPTARRRAVPGCLYCVQCQEVIEKQGR